MFVLLTNAKEPNIIKKYLSKGILAQLGEHLPYKQRVIGSSPIGPIDNYIVAMLVWRNWQTRRT